MNLSVIAVDYDGTVAKTGRTNPCVVAAIEEARADGAVVILVTGQILSHLKRVLRQHR